LGAAIAKETVLLILYKCLPFRLMSHLFCHSLSALQAIKGSIYKVKNYIIYDIYNIFTSLNNMGTNVILEWIPSHVGIHCKKSV
jgi:hypothetical protein